MITHYFDNIIGKQAQMLISRLFTHENAKMERKNRLSACEFDYFYYTFFFHCESSCCAIFTFYLCMILLLGFVYPDFLIVCIYFCMWYVTFHSRKLIQYAIYNRIFVVMFRSFRVW